MARSMPVQQRLAALRRRFSWLGFLKLLWMRVYQDKVLDLAAETAYFFGLALFPFLIVMGAIVGTLPFTDCWKAILTWITHYFPRDSQALVFTTIFDLTQGHKGVLSFGLLSTIFAASAGLMSLGSALNSVYEVEESRTYLRRLGICVVMLFVLVALMLATFGLLSAGGWFDGWLSAHISSDIPIGVLSGLARWIASIVLMTLTLNLLDYTLPNRKRRWTWVTPGTALVVGGWLVATVAFNFYVARVASYNKTYGVLGAFIVLMVWAYLASLIALVGALVNAEMQKMKEQRGRAGARVKIAPETAALPRAS